MVWKALNPKQSIAYNSQIGITPLNRAARAATKYKMYSKMEASTEASREKMKTIESFSLGNLVRELKSKI